MNRWWSRPGWMLVAWLVLMVFVVAAFLYIEGHKPGHVATVSVVVSDDCRTGSDPGDPVAWPMCGGK